MPSIPFPNVNWSKLRLWHFSIFCSGFMFFLGFTGTIPFLDSHLLGGKDSLAILAGVVMFAASVIMTYFPPPERRKGPDRPQIAVSPDQIALAAKFKDWTHFDDAVEENKLDDEHGEKVVQLRIELATMQGLLMRRIDEESGKHQIRYRYADDTTTFVGDDQ